MDLEASTNDHAPERIMANDLPYEPPSYSKSRRRGKLILGLVAVMAIVAIVLGVSLGVNRNGSTSSSGTRDDTSLENEDTTFVGAPTVSPAPTSTPVRLADVVDFLVKQGISSERNLNTQGTAQNLAARWIADEDALQMPFGKDNYRVGVVNEAFQFVTRYVFAVFFFATNGPTSWIGSARFLSGRPVCGWFDESFLGQEIGIFCDQDWFKPQRIRFDLHGLSGSIPSELAKVWTLESIDFEINLLNGTVPQEIADLPLRTLILRRNSISGPLPSKLGENGKLQSLILSNNRFSGSVPSSLSKSTLMRFFALDDNMFTGDITNILTNEMSQLSHVFVEDNLLTGTLNDKFLTNHSSLLFCDMSDNAIDGAVPAQFFGMSTLEVLDLHGNNIVGPLPEFPPNDKLSFVALHENDINGRIPDSITNLLDLRHLDLSQNDLSGPMPLSLNNMTRLRYLFLAANDFEDGDIPDYGNLRNLRELSLKSTSRTGPVPDFLANLENLVLLDLDDNQLTGPVPGFLVNMTSLYAVLLNRNDLSGPIPPGLGNLENLRLLYLDRNSLTGSLDEACALLDFSPVSNNQLAADCGVVLGVTTATSASEVSCSCCTYCCSDGTDEGCHSNGLVPSTDPFWEIGYNRPEFIFGNESILDAAAP